MINKVLVKAANKIIFDKKGIETHFSYKMDLQEICFSLLQR